MFVITKEGVGRVVAIRSSPSRISVRSISSSWMPGGKNGRWLPFWTNPYSKTELKVRF